MVELLTTLSLSTGLYVYSGWIFADGQHRLLTLRDNLVAGIELKANAASCTISHEFVHFWYESAIASYCRD